MSMRNRLPGGYACAPANRQAPMWWASSAIRMMVDLNAPGQPAGWLVLTACGYDCSTKQHRPRASPLHTEPWFISYGLLGLTQNGLVPVLMPLAAPHGGAAGLTYAAFSLLGVLRPVPGELGRPHRPAP
jgi:hypothetical protein